MKVSSRQIEGPNKPPKTRQYEVYTVNYKGPPCYEDLTMPPLLENLSCIQLEEFVNKPFTSEFECHTQCCERMVSNTSACVKRRRTEDTQLGIALSTVAARNERPNKLTKKSFASDVYTFSKCR